MAALGEPARVIHLAKTPTVQPALRHNQIAPSSGRFRWSCNSRSHPEHPRNIESRLHDLWHSGFIITNDSISRPANDPASRPPMVSLFGESTGESARQSV